MSGNDEKDNLSASRSTTSKESNAKESEESIIKWVDQLKDEKTREIALNELSRKRESFADLAIYIWYSTGTVSAL